MPWNEKAEHIMAERFGKDTIIPLATVENGIPYVRNVNAFYEDGSFYVITHALSNKMRHIRENPTLAIAGDWFTGHARGTNLGLFCAEKNQPIAEKLRSAFASWIDNGHNDFTDENTIILRLDLRDAVLLSHGTQYERTKDDLRKMDEERIRAEAQTASMASAVLLHRRMIFGLHELDVSADEEHQIDFRRYFGMSAPTAKKDRERACCMRYEEYEVKYNEYVASDEGKRIIRLLDVQCPNMRISDAVKAYFMLRLNRV